MGRCPFVQGRVVRIDLPGGEWLDVKAELNCGEEDEMFAAMRMDAEPLHLDPVKVFRVKAAAYLLGWSFTMPDGTPAPVTPSALAALDHDTRQEVRDAIDAHEAAIVREWAVRKNARDGAIASAPISPLPV